MKLSNSEVPDFISNQLLEQHYILTYMLYNMKILDEESNEILYLKGIEVGHSLQFVKYFLFVIRQIFFKQESISRSCIGLIMYSIGKRIYVWIHCIYVITSELAAKNPRTRVRNARND